MTYDLKKYNIDPKNVIFQQIRRQKVAKVMNFYRKIFFVYPTSIYIYFSVLTLHSKRRNGKLNGSE